jgi:hypothetical protein
MGLAATAIRQAATAKDLHAALDHLDRAEQTGADLRRVKALRGEAQSMLKVLSRGGSMPRLPGPARAREKKPKKAPPWKGKGSILDDF